MNRSEMPPEDSSQARVARESTHGGKGSEGRSRTRLSVVECGRQLMSPRQQKKPKKGA